MGRKAEPGIKYYRMECNHIRNKKIRLLYNEFDAAGYWVWQCILSYAYENKGYYFDTNDKEALELFASEVCKKRVSQVEEIIIGCVRRSLFDKGVFEMFGVLSSAEMQEVYLDATAERRRKGTVVSMVSDYMLITPGQDDLKRWENVELFGDKIIVPRKNSIIPSNNEVDPVNNPESKVKKSKVKESKEELFVPETETVSAPSKDPLSEKQIKLIARQQEFYKQLTGYLPNYSKEMLRAFYNHWSEPNRSKTKMKCEMEDTWDLKLRLDRWEKNDAKFNKGKILINGKSETENEYRRKREELEQRTKRLQSE